MEEPELPALPILSQMDVNARTAAVEVAAVAAKSCSAVILAMECTAPLLAEALRAPPAASLLEQNLQDATVVVVAVAHVAIKRNTDNAIQISTIVSTSMKF